MKKIIIYLLMLSTINFVSAQDKIIKSLDKQFNETLSLYPQKVFFVRDGKQYSVQLPFKVSDQTASKLLRLANTSKIREYMDEMEEEDLYEQHITNGNRDKYFDGSVKQWGQLDEAAQEDFKKNIMPKMKEYYVPLENISFSDIMQMLINSSATPSSNECGCIDLNGVKIQSCEKK